MPISGTIYQQARTPKPSGFATLADFAGQFLQAREQREVNKDRKLQREMQQQDRDLRQQEIAARTQTLTANQRKLENDEQKIAKTRELMQQHTTPEGIDFEGVLEGLYSIDPDAAMELDKHLDERAKTKRETAKAELDARRAQLDSDAKDQASYLERFAVAKTPEQWAEVWADASENKMLRVLKGTGLTGVFTPDGPARAADLKRGVTGRDALEVKAQAAAATATDDARLAQTAAETARHNRAMEQRPAGGGATSPVSVIGPDGKPVYVKPQDAYGKQPANLREQGPSTGASKRVLNFFNRAKQASEELEGLETWLGGLGLGGQTRLEMAPNVMQTPEGRQYIAAQRAFTEARLRKDSGAAIPSGEYDNDRKTYFPQPGDDAKTLAQKKRARAALLASLAFESGAALKEFYGDDAEGMIQGYRNESDTNAGKQKIGRFEIEVGP